MFSPCNSKNVKKKKYSEFLGPKNKNKNFVKDYLIYTKFKLNRIEHLQEQEFISPELYFNKFTRSKHVCRKIKLQ